MAMSILQAMSKVVAEMIAVYMLKQLISGFMGPDFAPGYESAIGRQDFSNFADMGRF